jgi:hypothetical protein
MRGKFRVYINVLNTRSTLYFEIEENPNVNPNSVNSNFPIEFYYSVI